MAKINFGGVEENVITREEFPLSKAAEILKDETIAVIGYGVQANAKTPKHGTKQSLTAGYRARPSSKSKKPAKKGPLSNTCCRMPDKSLFGRPLKNT